MAMAASADVLAAEKLALEIVASPARVLERVSKGAFDNFLRVAVERYHNSDAPLVGDDVYDLLLSAYRKRFPKSDVPLVAAPDDGSKVALPVWMGSLSKLVDDPEALGRWRAAHRGGHVLSDKLDGISGLLEVREAGGGVRLLTRGDGTHGRDVTFLTRMMKHFPLPPAPAAGAGPLLVRGELILSRVDFVTLKRGASPRNVANGVINATRHPDAEVAAAMKFVAYELIPSTRGAPSLPPSQQLKQLKDWGLPVVNWRLAGADDLTQEVLAAHLVRRQTESEFDIDGIVTAADEAYPRESGKNPTTAFAFKTLAALTERVSTLREVEWSVSVDGRLKPTLVFEPVTIDGRKIERATGHNARFIEAHQLGPGARVRVVLSGGVIPRVLGKVAPEAGLPATPSQPAVAAQMPTQAFVWDASHVDALVDRSVPATADQAQAQGVRELFHQCETLGVRGVGKARAAHLWAAGLKTVESLATATPQALEAVEGIRATGAASLRKAVAHAIAGANCVAIAVASNAFGSGIGIKKLGEVMRAHPDFAQKTPTQAQLLEVPTVGAETAKKLLASAPAFAQFLSVNPSLAARCAAVAAAVTPPKRASAAQRAALLAAGDVDLTGKTFVLTGFTSDVLEAYVAARGGRVVGTVSAGTTAVIAKDPASASRKVKDALRLGVRVVPLSDVMDPAGVVSVRSLSPPGPL